jgi:LmbE family N-acetylglucosaminyl deacetylase
MPDIDLWSIPNLKEAKRVLCVQPHPDDIDISCGGTIALLSAEGAHVTYVTVTDGRAGSAERRDEVELANARRREQESAGAFLGVRDFMWLNYRDGDELPYAMLESDIIREIRVHKPDTVITIDPWLPYEAHPAHRQVGLCTASAVLLSGLANICPEQVDAGLDVHTVNCIAFAFTSKPNTYLDVTSHWEQKMKAIRIHQSQFPDDVWPTYRAYFEAKATAYGQHIGAKYAEALKVLKPIHLHCNVDAMDM